MHFIAAMISGLVTTIASMPVDIVKTRLQNQKVNFQNTKIQNLNHLEFFERLRRGVKLILTILLSLLMESQNIKALSMCLPV